MLTPSFYVTTVTPEDNETHRFRIPVTDTVPEGHEVTDMRPAGQFTFAQLLSAAQRTMLAGAVRRNRGKHRK